MVNAYIGLGSNLNNPVQQVKSAIEDLDSCEDLELLQASSLYQSPPMGPQDQPDYINAVAKIATDLTAPQLLALLQDIEQKQGRVRGGEKWAARSLDLDILLYGDKIISSESLVIPHYGLYERAFVLYPLQEIAPQDLEIPGHGMLAQLLARCDKGSLELIGKSGID